MLMVLRNKDISSWLMEVYGGYINSGSHLAELLIFAESGVESAETIACNLHMHVESKCVQYILKI